MVEVAMADSGFELGRNFRGETGICGDVLTSLPASLVSLSGCIRCNPVVFFTSRLAFLFKGGWSEPLDLRGALPFLFLEPAEAGRRVFMGLFFFGDLYSDPRSCGRHRW